MMMQKEIKAVKVVMKMNIEGKIGRRKPKNKMAEYGSE
jgi:hypothetical protein